MSENFNKNCYTSRSSGYKYRTLSTNTGERKRRKSKDDDIGVDKKFRELQNEITLRINNQMGETQRARSFIQEKLEKISSKINSMVALQNNVTMLRTDLHHAEDALADMEKKVEWLEAVTSGSEGVSLYTPKSSIPRAPILEENYISDKLTKNPLEA